MDPNTQPTMPQTQPVLQPTNAPAKEPQASSSFEWLLITLMIVLVLIGGVAAYLFYTKSASTQPAYQQAQPTSGIPQIKVTDLSPGVPNADKVVILVQHSDSSQEKVIIKKDLAAGYIKSLPQTEEAVSQTPAGK